MTLCKYIKRNNDRLFAISFTKQLKNNNSEHYIYLPRQALQFVLVTAAVVAHLLVGDEALVVAGHPLVETCWVATKIQWHIIS